MEEKIEPTKKEWNDLLDQYLIDGSVDDLEVYTKLTDYQYYCINEVKKSIERIKNK